MKRSDMIQVIHERLVGQPLYEMVLQPNFAEILLTFIEDMGMAPPETHILKNSYDRANGQMGYFVHEWDDEDAN